MRRAFTSIELPAVRRGFTLIELLVVITIIVVLLALLTPALDKAIYSAELTVCGSNLHSIATGAITYAVDHKRSYPVRTAGDEGMWDAMQIKNQNWDIPGQLSGYVGPNAFRDPLGGDIELDAGSNEEKSATRPETIFMPGYHVYFDWGHKAVNVTRMKKMGQRMVFTEPNTGEVSSFRVMAADHDVRVPGRWCHTSHPDDQGIQRLVTYQNAPNPYFFGVDAVAARVTGTQWENMSAPGERGLLDNNYSMDDGSVQRLNGVPIVEGDEDPRISFVPDIPDLAEYNTGRVNQLPRSN